MKKNSFMVFALLMLSQLSHSQTLHAFLFCKTSDPKIGMSVKINQGNIQEVSQIIANAIDYKYVEHSLSGLNFNVENVRKTIEEVKINSEDIIILYFSTHGAKSKWDSNIFPQIDVPDSLLSAYKIHKNLLGKKPKSVFTMIEACSGFQRITPQEAFIYQTIQEDDKVEKQIIYRKENIRKLFLSSCSTIITAGQPGLNTWATTEGSMFTNCFRRTFDEYSDMTDINKVTFDNLLKQCKEYTYDMTRTTRLKYYPVWERGNCDGGIVAQLSDTIVPIKNIALDISCAKKNRSRNPYDINLELSGPKEEMALIKKVVYFLDVEMPKPIVTSTKREDNFYYGYFSVRGEFPIKAKVYYTDGTVIELYDSINFKKCK